MNLKTLPAITLLLVLASCSDSGSSSAPPAKTESVFKTQTEALEKAKQVEKITQDAAAKEKQQVEEQTN